MVGSPQECDCPFCADAQPASAQVGALLPEAIDLDVMQEPLEVEVPAAMLLAIGSALDVDFDRAVREQFVPTFEAQATPQARAMLSALGSVADGEAGRAASAAARRLAEAGVGAPPWLAELDAPVTVDQRFRYTDAEGFNLLLTGRFRRAGRSHVAVVVIDDCDCGAARDILLVDADGWDAARNALLSEMRAGGVDVTERKLQPAGFRRAVEAALDNYADHDEDLGGPGGPPEEEGPGTAALALLLRSWLRGLPAPRTTSRGDLRDGELTVASISALLDIIAPGAPVGAVPGPRRPAALPGKRRKSAGQAPIYQVKVSLRGARPPIWRRLQVPADVGLARLHELIQVAFGWTDSHLHVFETPYGSFGRPDTDLGHRAESRVTLEQVAPNTGDRLRYTYDFGDNWELDILVEKAFDRDAAEAYPRCVGGRRAAPPEDCGGVRGYAELVEILADPTHPEHRERLEWLSLDNLNDFDPARFEAAAVTVALQRVR
ncbi:pRiA4b ORF-3-like protein [Micromonospora siamensis]|uniref:PRiA4b ORF-3-like protein n=1 Tax=Micromonospora siamensis TaxID=299152 RepID=A0A1C5J0A0_9ACTN|nr:pRiA4b ORF-3-like protein [Micromonospora siamensis]